MNLLGTLLGTVRSLLPDSAVAWGVRGYFNDAYSNLGLMTTLQIDATARKAVFDIELKGEPHPLHVTIDRYEVTTEGNQTFVEILEFTSSREWINLLGRELLKGKKFKVPEIAKALL